VPNDIVSVIRNSGAGPGDLIYIRSAQGNVVDGARLTTSRDLLHLKAEALQLDEPLVAIGPATDETYADVVIDADLPEPTVVKSRQQNGAGHVNSPI
jgi:hypothetical protein